MDKLKENGMTACAITDHGVMFGVVEFYKALKANGIKPVIGCEVYVAVPGRNDKTARVDDGSHHLVLLAKDYEGYKNLMKLCSMGFTEGFYYKPRIDKEILREHSKGLIGLSACLAGEIPSLMLKGDVEGAEKIALEYKEIFDEGDFYIELQSNGVEVQDRLNHELAEMARRLDIPLVATNDSHYVRKEDARVHDVLLCIQTGTTVNDRHRMRFASEEFYVKSSEEMGKLFDWVPEAIENTVRIAERCDVELDFNTLHVPDFEVPEGKTVSSYLRELCMEGAFERYGLFLSDEVRERLEYELSVIEQMGYCGYFLIVWDFVNFARKEGIYVGPGRGSAPGSVVAYCLGITSLDPFKYDLLFERFLNPARVTMPDIDMDFCYERRGEVIDYVVRKYGVDHVSQIITFGTMAARAAIRDVGRALDLPYADVDRIAKLVPAELNITLDKAIQAVPELKEASERKDEIGTLLEIARAVEGNPRHASTHAAGVVISKDPLVETVPLYKTSDDVITTQFPMEDLESLGVLKMDFLGLRTLTVIGKAVKLIKANRGVDLDMDSIPLDDEGVFEMLRQSDSSGVFQLESGLFQGLLKEVKPTRFEDIIALVALGRPGPMMMTGDFVKGKHGGEVKYIHPALEPILNSTYGVMLYQEQVMRVASELAGFSLAEADLLRRAMGKKKADVIAGMKDKFVSGAIAKGVEEPVAREVFSLIERFAGYGFNAAHSAAYALISYQTAYLRYHYFTEFMAATLSSVMGSSERIAGYIESCKSKGVRVLPPDVNESGEDFTVVGNNIRFGLTAVKGVGASAAKLISDVRKERGRFVSLLDFCEKTGSGNVNRKALESLIKAGAMQSLGSRKALLMVMEDVCDQAQRSQKQAESGQASFFDLFDEPMEFASSEVELPDVEEYDISQILAWEREYLGLYISGHPLISSMEVISRIANVTTDRLSEKRSGDVVIVAGIVTSKKQISTKGGQMMAFVQLEDMKGQVEVVVFPRVFEQCYRDINVDSVIAVKGKVDFKEEAKVIAEFIKPLPKSQVKA